jgi:hypothetical protein
MPTEPAHAKVSHHQRGATVGSRGPCRKHEWLHNVPFGIPVGLPAHSGNVPSTQLAYQRFWPCLGRVS